MGTKWKLEKIVTDYINRFLERAEKELRWFAIQRNFEEGLRLSAFAEGPRGKRFKHQRRIPKSVLRESHRCLLDELPLLQKARSFEELHALVASSIQGIRGIGELTVYDTALRIGAMLGLEPSIVFLHSGTRLGARRLDLDVSREFLTIEEVPPALKTLRPREIEDVLCIYKDRFVRGYRVRSLNSGCCG